MIDKENRPKGHRYSVDIIQLAISFYTKAKLGFRKISSVLRLLGSFSGFNTTHIHHSTVYHWVVRLGFYLANRQQSSRDDWVILSDFTNQVGTTKCLVSLGVNMKEIQNNRRDLTLRYEDVKIVLLYPMASSKAEHIQKALEEVKPKIGGEPFGVISDSARDIKKGIRLAFNSPTTIAINDIPHKLALLLQYELEDTEEFKNFNKELYEARSRLRQSELASLMPPGPRAKGRFMNMPLYLKWCQKIKDFWDSGVLNRFSKLDLKNKFGWIKKQWRTLTEWIEMINCIEIANKIVRKRGISKRTNSIIRWLFKRHTWKTQRTYNFAMKVQESVSEEVKKLRTDDQVMIGSTEILESIIGTFKAFGEFSHLGITRRIFGLALFTDECSAETIKIGLESCKTSEVRIWWKEIAGETIHSIRREIRDIFKKTLQTI